MFVDVLSKENYNTRSCLQVLFYSGILGFSLGLHNWTIQWALEHGQILARVVNYQANSPLAMIQAKMWSFITQLTAALLLVGLDEFTISKILSGIHGMLAIQSLALIVYSLKMDVIFAVFSAILIYYSNATGHGVIYNISLVNSRDTYGNLGLLYAVLTISIVSIGWFREGLFMLGCAPAIQLTIGSWLILNVSLAIFFSSSDIKRGARESVPWFCAGAILSLTSFLIHYKMSVPIEAIDPLIASSYLRSWVQYWDNHRKPISMTHKGVQIVIMMTIISLIMLKCWHYLLTQSCKFMLLITATGGVASMMAAKLGSLNATFLPDIIQILMPARFLNIYVFMSPPIIIGLISSIGFRIQRELLSLSAFLMFIMSSKLLNIYGPSPKGIYKLLDWSLFLGPFVITAIIATRYFVIPAYFINYIARMNYRSSFYLKAFSIAVIIGIITIDLSKPHRGLDIFFFPEEQSARINDNKQIYIGVPPTQLSQQKVTQFSLNTDATIIASSFSNGTIIQPNILFAQTLFHRPFLIDPIFLNTLPYALEAAPLIARIVLDIYGEDLMSPPKGSLHTGFIPVTPTRDLWEAREPEDWQRLANKYIFTQVLTPSDWSLKLKVVATSPYFKLYNVMQKEN